jgi:transglutaminase-like putative cysteine protease
VTTPPLDRHRFRIVVILLGLVMLGHVHWLPPLYAAWLFAMLGFARWRAHREVRPAPVWIRLPLLVATLGLLIYGAGSPIGREGGSAMLGGLIVLKLLESTQRRDVRVITAAALFFCMIGFLFGQGLLLTLYFCAVATLCFLVLHLSILDDPASNTRLIADLRRGLRVSARVAAAALPLTLVAFVFFPRLSSPLWGAPWDATQGRTGISDRMRPGALSRLWNDDTPAFRVTFDGEAPPAAMRYWRGPVLWTFNGEEWARADLYAATAPARIEADAGSVVDYEILMEPTEQSWWFPLDLPLAVPNDARITGDGQVRARRPLIGPRSERFRSAWRYRFDLDAAPGQRWMGLQLPARGNPRARELAAAWRARHGNNHQAVIDEALALFNRDFMYTLEPPPLTREIVDDFLFNTKAGYCEYYASSFVFLMRAAGIPARVVTGYQGGMYNGAGGYWIVRNSDAHAWSEVWLEGQGWVRVDPTAAVAPERIDRGSLAAAMPEAARWYSEGWGLEWRNRFDLIARYWRQAVIEFDAVRQRNLLQQVGLEDMSWQALGGGLLVFGAIALALGAWLSLRGLDTSTRDPLVLAYRRFNTRLARAGVAREAGEGPIAFGERAAQSLPRAAPAILELTRRFAEQRYGVSAHDADASHRRRLAQELRAFRVRR